MLYPLSYADGEMRTGIEPVREIPSSFQDYHLNHSVNASDENLWQKNEENRKQIKTSMHYGLINIQVLFLFPKIEASCLF